MATWGFPGKQSAEMGIDSEALREAAPAASPPPFPLQILGGQEQVPGTACPGTGPEGRRGEVGVPGPVNWGGVGAGRVSADAGGQP